VGEEEPEDDSGGAAEDKGNEEAFPGIGRFFCDLLEQGKP
jgi:hypothetical protein